MYTKRKISIYRFPIILQIVVSSAGCKIPFAWRLSTPNRVDCLFRRKEREKERRSVCFSQRRALSRAACKGSNGKRTSDHWYSFNWMECVDFVRFGLLLAGQKSVPLPSRPVRKVCQKVCLFSSSSSSSFFFAFVSEVSRKVFRCFFFKF